MCEFLLDLAAVGGKVEHRVSVALNLLPHHIGKQPVGAVEYGLLIVGAAYVNADFFAIEHLLKFFLHHYFYLLGGRENFCRVGMVVGVKFQTGCDV